MVVDTPLVKADTEITALELKSLLDSGCKLCLVDVRQPEEHQLVKIQPSALFPLDELSERIDELRLLTAEADQTVFYCHVGMRSELAVNWLSTQGFTDIKNLSGGINAYAREADTSLTPY